MTTLRWRPLADLNALLLEQLHATEAMYLTHGATEDELGLMRCDWAVAVLEGTIAFVRARHPLDGAALGLLEAELQQSRALRQRLAAALGSEYLVGRNVTGAGRPGDGC